MTEESKVNDELENVNNVEQVPNETPSAHEEHLPLEEVRSEIKAENEEDAKEMVATKTAEAAVKKENEEAAAPVVKPDPNVPESFDWDTIGKKHEFYSASEREKLEKVYDKTLSQIAEHEVLNGIIVGKTSRELVVNIGFKSDGVIPLSELRYNPNIKLGDEIEVYVESQEDPSGQLILSHKKARILKSWERVNQAYDTQEIINGYVKCRTKGGLIVDVFGIEAFLPGSQIDVETDTRVYTDG